MVMVSNNSVIIGNDINSNGNGNSSVNITIIQNADTTLLCISSPLGLPALPLNLPGESSDCVKANYF